MIKTPVIVLAGGLGTRLRASVPDLPKVLAPIADKPFIEVLLSWLEKQGVEKVVFSLGYQAELVIKHLARITNNYALNIDFVVEPKPLGTLGGASLALTRFNLTEAIVVNGDTWVDVDLVNFEKACKQEDIGLVCHQVADVSRYGALELNQHDYVQRFCEKPSVDSFQENIKDNNKGVINAGIYYFNQDVIATVKSLEHGSLEERILASGLFKIKSFPSSGAGFIDIGTAESYALAPEVLKEYLL